MRSLQTSLLVAGDVAVDRHATADRRWLDDRTWVDVVRGYVSGADEVLVALASDVDWRQGRRKMFDRWVDEPRLSRWYRRADALPHPVLDDIAADLERRYRVTLRGPGLNHYRDGRDSVAPHRDTELRWLDDTLVAIVTFGGRRPFHLRPVGGGASLDVAPASGDLLVMGGRAQADWEHGVPKVRHADPRISASWRWSSRNGPAARRSR
ncbi:MAG: alpha-ketoglutarate-dependent dioxygenase AlkB [Acidimicrobiales bacterium]|nr:alpha-ketoglutarate-dependent dioxygenase AlkB [Acidimicrobiales bacterium]